MLYIEDKEIDLTGRTTNKYILSSQHRGRGNKHKSIWIITHVDEIECFIQTINENWTNGREAWGIKVDHRILQVVGISTVKSELKLAKFVDGTSKNVWHGYPADYLSKSQDRPTTGILKSWVLNGYITKAKMSKIRLGQSCSL
jgi:hypothetical protein